MEGNKMKKMILFLLFILCGCAPQPTLRDSACGKARTVRVVRVTNDTILGWTNVEGDKSVYSYKKLYHPTDAHYVYLKREPHQLYYPGQILKIPDSSCVKYSGSKDYVISGRYRATTLEGKMGQAEYSNPEYEALTAERLKKAKTSCWMRRRLGQKCNKK